MNEEGRAYLLAGLEALGLDTGLIRVNQLQRFLELMRQWNRIHNLTAIRDELTLVSHHVLDSLSVLPYLHGNTVLDVGSGAGLPGIPLALYQPEYHFTLLDASVKRVHFLRHCIVELALKNVSATHGRIEQYTPSTGFDTVISRAFASLADFARSTRHTLAPGGRLLAMKGRYPAQELEALPKELKVYAIHELHVPGMDAQRHLVELGWEANGDI
jgi:16S rRNA (guanine527-N7)-methyltransferase